MINNKKISLIYIVCLFLFLTLILFPNYNSKTKLLTYSLKEKIDYPFIYISDKVRNIFVVLNLNFNYSQTIRILESENEYLRSINKYLLTLNSKFSEQNKIFHNTNLEIPISVGVKIIGDKNLVYNNNFIINKGSNSGLTLGNYIIDGLNIVGRVININFNTSEVVTVKSINYGDEVFINGKSYIVSGTNNNYLSFLRQKNSTEIPDLKSGDIATVNLNNVILRLGIVNFDNEQPILLTGDIINFENLRAVIND